VQAAGAKRVPAGGVTAVVLNVTVTDPTEAAYRTVYAGASALPLASNVHITAGETISNLAMCRWARMARSSSSTASVVLNVTVNNPTAASFLTVYGNDVQTPPTASNLNFTPGETMSNLVVVPVDVITAWCCCTTASAAWMWWSVWKVTTDIRIVDWRLPRSSSVRFRHAAVFIGLGVVGSSGAICRR
jgi:hypothetical protein